VKGGWTVKKEKKSAGNNVKKKKEQGKKRNVAGLWGRPSEGTQRKGACMGEKAKQYKKRSRWTILRKKGRTLGGKKKRTEKKNLQWGGKTRKNTR